MEPREIIHTIGPAVRAVVFVQTGRLPIYRFTEDAEAMDKNYPCVLDLADTTAQTSAGQLIEQFRQELTRCHCQSPDVVKLAGLGLFERMDDPLAEPTGRVAGKVAMVTGAAQGFGLEIAQNLAGQGAWVVLADINESGAREAAEALCEAHGPGQAIGMGMNVTDPASIAGAVDQVVRRFGGLDVLVSNAGVLKAESVKTQPLKDFQFVTDENYTGYFLCVQAVAPLLAAAHAAEASYTSDIIQINSKSGLEGSNRNAAYAGSKFGGLGLTQSFALELIEDGVKVNSICPGNLFDGPLWSDPEDGLFVQYLRTGKVEGAKTIEDVRRGYEAKVPMGRGYETTDVTRAIYYLIEQQYETGQALPVTGGQVLLK
jgi:sorbitol-6-phosphate 2-dehydrogenase